MCSSSSFGREKKHFLKYCMILLAKSVRPLYCAVMTRTRCVKSGILYIGDEKKSFTRKGAFGKFVLKSLFLIAEDNCK